GESGEAQPFLAEGEDARRVRVTEQAAGVARPRGFDKAAADGDGGTDADLLAGDGPYQGFERRSRDRDAQAPVAGDQRPQQGMIGVPLLELLDILREAEHAPGECTQ